jgi:hypothetical protein
MNGSIEMEKKERTVHSDDVWRSFGKRDLIVLRELSEREMASAVMWCLNIGRHQLGGRRANRLHGASEEEGKKAYSQRHWWQSKAEAGGERRHLDIRWSQRKVTVLSEVLFDEKKIHVRTDVASAGWAVNWEGGESGGAEMHVFTVGKKPLRSPIFCVERRWNLRRKVRSIDRWMNGSIEMEKKERTVHSDDVWRSFGKRDLIVLRELSEREMASAVMWCLNIGRHQLGGRRANRLHGASEEEGKKAYSQRHWWQSKAEAGGERRHLDIRWSQRKVTVLSEVLFDEKKIHVRTDVASAGWAVNWEGGESGGAEMHVFTVGKKPLRSPTFCVERRWNLRRKVRSIDRWMNGSIEMEKKERTVHSDDVWRSFGKRDLIVLRELSEREMASAVMWCLNIGRHQLGGRRANRLHGASEEEGKKAYSQRHWWQSKAEAGGERRHLDIRWSQRKVTVLSEVLFDEKKIHVRTDVASAGWAVNWEGGESGGAEMHVFTVGKKPLRSPIFCVERRWNLRRKVRSIDRWMNGSIEMEKKERTVHSDDVWRSFGKRDLIVLRELSEREMASAVVWSLNIGRHQLGGRRANRLHGASEEEGKKAYSHRHWWQSKAEAGGERRHLTFRQVNARWRSCLRSCSTKKKYTFERTSGAQDEQWIEKAVKAVERKCMFSPWEKSHWGRRHFVWSDVETYDAKFDRSIDGWMDRSRWRRRSGPSTVTTFEGVSGSATW